MDSKLFYRKVRETVFGGRMKQSQVDTLNAILDCKLSKAQMAYVMGTALHEAGADMAPVREGFARTDADARRIVANMHRRGRISTNYAAPDPITGQSYYGRGLVQLTWKDNYEKAGKKLKINLVDNPDLALVPDVAVKILVEGMKEGWFAKDRSGKVYDLDRFIKGNKKDYEGARRIVNGLDRAEKIAGYARRFESALKHAEA